jgi:single-stranded DNA-binding protein
MEEGDQVSTFVVAVGTVDGEVKVNQVGDQHKSVANFRIFTNPGWYSVAAWEGLASKVPPAGTNIIVQGKLSGRSYEKTVGGETVKIPVVEIVASTIEVIGGATPAEDLFE